MNSSELENTIRQEAAQCVKCGLCLPVCPTYVQTQNECESGRGRIALMEGLITQQLSLTAKTQTYLDHCLTCRACEAVCPANVKYGKLIDHTRAAIVEDVIPGGKKAKIPLFWLLTLIIKHPRVMRVARALIRFYQRIGLQRLVRRAGLLKKLRLARAESFLPVLQPSQQWQAYYPAQQVEQGRVMLFIGCINNFVDQETIAAAIKVLTACGYGVHIPSDQQCCGAMHLHAGAANTAEQFAVTNRHIFAQMQVDTIVTLASGCAAVLQEYPLKIVDISQFLVENVWPDHVQLSPFFQRVVLHTPCTLRNVLKQADAPLQLLQKIPGIDLQLVKSITSCCGAAGTYMLQYPEMSDGLVENILREFSDLKPDWFVTSNVGCALHVNRAMQENSYKTRVAHPVVLIAQQLIV